MNCGRLSARNAAKNGSGWQSIVKHARLWAWQLGRGRKRLRANCGPVYQQSIANVRSVTRIFGRRMRPSCHRNVTVQLERKADKPTTSSGLTTTLRQRCSRLVRKTLSFSKKLANHIGALWYFIHDYNAQQRTKLAITTAA